MSHTGEKPYQCDHCKKSFKTMAELKIHYRNHTGVKPYTCKVCNKKFKYRYCFNLHMKKHSEEESDEVKKYTCIICNKSFKNDKMLTAHTEIHIGLKSHQCDQCQKCFTTKKSLESHYRIHSGERPYSCDLCNKKFGHKHQLYTHLEKHMNNDCIIKSVEYMNSETLDSLETFQSEKIFNNPKAFQNSEKSQNAEMKSKAEKSEDFEAEIKSTQKSFTETEFQSVILEERDLEITDDIEIEHKLLKEETISNDIIDNLENFDEKREVCEDLTNIHQKTSIQKPKKHRNNSTEEKPYSCEICGRSFKEKCNLKSHIFSHTGEKPYTCDICNRSFGTSGILNTHMKTHTDERPFQCKDCGKSFRNKEVLRYHKMIHDGIFPYACDLCEKSFRSISLLNRHKMSHTGEKPHQCDHCTKSFKTSGELRIHYRSHTGVKPYSCEVCSKKFKYRPSYTDHMKKHNKQENEDEQYTCIICNKSFKNNRILTAHIEIHTGKKPYQCDQCQKCFKSPSLLEIHYRIHTGAKPYLCKVCGKKFRYNYSYKEHMKIHNEQKKVLKGISSVVDKRSKINILSDSGEKIEVSLPLKKCEVRLSKISRNFGQFVINETNEESFDPFSSIQIFDDNLHLDQQRGQNLEVQDATISIIGVENKENNETSLKSCPHDRGQSVLISLLTSKQMSTSLRQNSEISTQFRDEEVDEDTSDRRMEHNIHHSYNQVQKEDDDHLLIKTEEQSQVCNSGDYCHKISDKFDDLQNPLITPNKDANIYYSCDVCSKSFSCIEDLTTHKKTEHLNNVSYSCDFCAVLFSDPKQVDIHMEEEHFVQKLYSCVVCKKTFSEVASLIHHVKCHIKKKKESEKKNEGKEKTNSKVTCNECGFIFSNKQYIKHQNLCVGKLANTPSSNIIGEFVECFEDEDIGAEIEEETEHDVLQNVSAVEHSTLNSNHEITIEEFKIEPFDDSIV